MKNRGSASPCNPASKARHGGAASAAYLACLLAAGAPLRAEPLGRLFFTPEHRVQLERERLLGLREKPAAAGDTLTLSGIVQAGNGRSTIWIDGVPQHDTAAASGIRVEPDRIRPGTARVAVGAQAPASLKVGETIHWVGRRTSGDPGKYVSIHPAAGPTPARVR